MQNPKLAEYKIYHHTSTAPSKKVNAALLVSCYQILVLQKTPEEVYASFPESCRFIDFRDASYEGYAFELPLLECLKGFAKGVSLGWFDLSTFDIREYELRSSPENGGYNWIIPGKILAFRSPSTDTKVRNGLKGLTPNEYIPLFQNIGVTTIIRLNKKNYDSEKFTRHGFQFYDMYFIDGSVPDINIVKDFIKIAEEDGVVAVHCKAGLGRTGTLIGCYAMKHFGFTALEFIAWARLCRSGSVLGPQQQFLVDMQATLWSWGENFKNGIQDTEESKTLLGTTELSDSHKFKAKFGDYKQAEKLISSPLVETNLKKENSKKILIKPKAIKKESSYKNK